MEKADESTTDDVFGRSDKIMARMSIITFFFLGNILI